MTHGRVFYAPWKERKFMSGHLFSIDEEFLARAKAISHKIIKSSAWRHPVDETSECVLFVVQGIAKECMSGIRVAGVNSELGVVWVEPVETEGLSPHIQIAIDGVALKDTARSHFLSATLPLEYSQGREKITITLVNRLTGRHSKPYVFVTDG